MDKIPEPPLRHGYTTGACATACCVAAAELMFSGTPRQSVCIRLPRGEQVEFQLEDCFARQDYYQASVIKDAGDDPDVTHGALIFVQIKTSDVPGIRYHAGEGVGTVRSKGLKLPIGEAAINPVPRQMIQQHLQQVAERYTYQGGFEVTVGVKNGEVLAKKTMNARVGILGGLSILGTTGIVKPFSCSAYVASIQQAVDVAHANQHRHLVGVTGNTSLSAVTQRYQLPDMAIIEMGDFVGALLKQVRRYDLEKLSLFLGLAKLCKMAQGAMNLHSRFSKVDFDWLTQQVRVLDLPAGKSKAWKTFSEFLQDMQDARPLLSHLCSLARDKASQHLTCEIEIFAVDVSGTIVADAR